MKIHLTSPADPRTTTIETQHDVCLTEVYCGVGLPTDQGYFGVSMRDAGIEIVLTRPGADQHELAWSSTSSLHYRQSQEIVEMLSHYVGETGESEGAVDVVRRLLAELESYRNPVPQKGEFVWTPEDE